MVARQGRGIRRQETDETGRIQNFQGLQTMLKLLDVFQGVGMRGRSWISGLWIMCSSLEWKLRLRLLWSMLGVMGPGQGRGGRGRTPCWEREPGHRGGSEGEGAT